MADGCRAMGWGGVGWEVSNCCGALVERHILLFLMKFITKSSSNLIILNSQPLIQFKCIKLTIICLMSARKSLSLEVNTDLTILFIPK